MFREHGDAVLVHAHGWWTLTPKPEAGLGGTVTSVLDGSGNQGGRITRSVEALVGEPAGLPSSGHCAHDPGSAA